MKFSTLASLGGLAAVAAATYPDYQQSTCTGNTVTETVTVTAGAEWPPRPTDHGDMPPPPHPTDHGEMSQPPHIPDHGEMPTYTPPPVSTTTCDYPAQQTLKVVVGGLLDGKPDLTFKPNSVDAKVGDIIEFNFLAANHTLTQSEFFTPCSFNEQFDTGFNQFNPNNTDGLKLVHFEVKSEGPQWFYCKQPVGNHCGKGMVFGINPAGKMDQFIKNAIAQNGGVAPTGTGTGIVAPPTGMAAAPFKVDVGTDGGKGLKFDPPFLEHVKSGDKIIFDFRKLNHTLTESSFDKPCTKLNDGAFDTEFKNFNPDDEPGLVPTTLDVNSDGERYFYCRQGNGTPNGHCSAGMVFAINISKEKFEKFQAAARATLPAPKIKGRSPSL